jgi:hypothetical protein
VDNEWRVEPRNILVGTGMGVTPERLEEIEARRIQSERLNRPPPERPFSAVLSEAMERVAKEAAPDEGEALPLKPSRGGGLLSAYQREILGLDEEEENSGAKVLFKG